MSSFLDHSSLFCIPKQSGDTEEGHQTEPKPVDDFADFNRQKCLPQPGTSLRDKVIEIYLGQTSSWNLKTGFEHCVGQKFESLCRASSFVELLFCVIDRCNFGDVLLHVESTGAEGQGKTRKSLDRMGVKTQQKRNSAVRPCRAILTVLMDSRSVPIRTDRFSFYGQGFPHEVELTSFVLCGPVLFWPQIEDSGIEH